MSQHILFPTKTSIYTPIQNKSLVVNRPQSDFDNWPNSHQQKRNKIAIVTVVGQLRTEEQ